MASPGAIISVPGAQDDHYEENEYLVDRRRLKVDVVERLSQITIEQFSALQAQPLNDTQIKNHDIKTA
jgi:hypothetical protein